MRHCAMTAAQFAASLQRLCNAAGKLAGKHPVLTMLTAILVGSIAVQLTIATTDGRTQVALAISTNGRAAD